MTDFSDRQQVELEPVFQGAHEEAIDALGNDSVLTALARWRERSPQSDSGVDRLRLEQTRSFTISYDGESGSYWPDKSSNLVGETLVRKFLFRQGICQLDGLAPRLYVAKYKVEVMNATEYLLVCPYPTEAGNIAGLAVVCINQHLRGEAN